MAECRKINEFVSEMLRLSHLLFSPRTWHLIDGTLLSMQIASPWLVCMFVCGKMYGKTVDFFDILNYGWGSSILRVVLAEDFDFSSQHHMKCPALLQVLLAILLFIFSDFPASPSPLGCWLGRELHFAASSGRIWRCHVGPSEDVFHLLPLSLLP